MLELGVLVTVLVTLGSVRSAIVREFTAAQWHTAMLTQIVPVAAGAPVVAGLWLWLAWANGRGYLWARLAFVAIFGLLTTGLLISLSASLSEGILPPAPADLIAMAVLWLVGLAAVVLISTETAGRYYQQEPAHH